MRLLLCLDTSIGISKYGFQVPSCVRVVLQHGTFRTLSLTWAKVSGDTFCEPGVLSTRRSPQGSSDRKDLQFTKAQCFHRCASMLYRSRRHYPTLARADTVESDTSRSAILQSSEPAEGVDYQNELMDCIRSAAPLMRAQPGLHA